ncbi:non-heme iron oxygenase ferredoxin subunit [Streptomyces fuscichromogenes]|uniref:(2Fe-2S)-binding protein n=1 Tax=Streptomyces fuscichromogenes TaxID=1324013 RepID=A0A918CWJ9_9ACTN|nr:non-heme iron oxygenase ferredoxin subunit [Streptomyces fuscichromogenes]GGN40278.1 (2Fe-2S)-binding protein [Streptomyces fuscichromogenes]
MTDNATVTWERICSLSDLSETEGHRYPLTPPVAVFRQGDEVFITDDICTHATSSLSEGFVEDGAVECVLHAAKFCVRTGAALTAPATEPLATYPARVDDDGTVWGDFSSRNA